VVQAIAKKQGGLEEAIRPENSNRELQASRDQLIAAACPHRKGSFATRSRLRELPTSVVLRTKRSAMRAISSWIDRAGLIRQIPPALSLALALYVPRQIEDSDMHALAVPNPDDWQRACFSNGCGEQNQLAELRQCPPPPF
jgi:hypothetical protein